MNHERRLINLEEELRSRTATLTLDDGRQVHVSPVAWLTLADVPIQAMAAKFEGTDPPELTDQQRRLIRLYSRARPDPNWGTGESSIAACARSQVVTP
jgi:hypothetical protein